MGPKTKGGGVTAVKEIVGIGKTVYDILRDGRPSTKLGGQTFHALPKGVPENELFGGTQVVKTWKNEFVNVYGFSMADCEIMLRYAHGVQWRNTPDGKYLMNVTIAARNPSVAWGIDYSASVEILGKPRNVGTPEAPNPKLTINCRTLATAINAVGIDYTVEIWGDGRSRIS